MTPKSNRICVTCMALVAAMAIAVSRPEAGAAIDARLVTSFLGELQRAVARDDRPDVAAMVQYPLVVLAGDIRIPFAGAAALIQSYDVVFSPALKTVIAQAALPAPGRAAPAYPVMIAEHLVTIGGELIRIQPVGGALKITGIREPLAQLPAQPSAAAAGRAAPRAEPRRLTLQVGRTQMSGALAPGGRDAYVVYATKNQLIEARINGVSGRDIVLHIADVKTREPLDARAREGVRTWAGRVPAEGDYLIDVQRLAATGEPRLPYVLIISLR